MAQRNPDFEYLRRLVAGLSQNILDPSRDYLFETRLGRLVREQGLSCLEELVEQVKRSQDPRLERSIAEAMTINETSFFRDGRPFELLRTELLPALIEARRAHRTLHLWSAACSTGQEAYSLAMMIREHFPALAGWKVRIDATDICAEVVERARSGRYQRIEINRGLPARFVVRYFEHHGDEWHVKPEIRQMCHFRQAGLSGHAQPFARGGQRFDIILLRNVMLYFSQATRRELLARVHRMLAPDGVLFLGSSEQPADLSQWSAVLAGGTCYYRPLPPNAKP